MKKNKYNVIDFIGDSFDYICGIIICIIIVIIVMYYRGYEKGYNEGYNNSNDQIYNLESCPLCNNNNVEINSTKDNTYYIECTNCKLKSENFKSVEELIEFWNNRKG